LIAAATTTQTQTSTPNPREAEFVHRAAWKAGVIGAVNVLLVVLAVRIILLVAVIGALYLAKIAIDAPAPLQVPALVMLGVYSATVVIPMVWLSSRR
jgi:hypothetical protein